MLSNTRESYGWITIALHWIAAFGVIALWVLGYIADRAGELGDREGRAAAMGAHISLGATLFLFFLARIVAHYVQVRPEKPAQPALLNTLSVITQHALLIGLAIQIISGPLAVWSGGRDINVFDLFVVPTPFAGRDDGAHELAEVLHAIGRWVILCAFVLHVAGALKHLFVDRDGVFSRILRPEPLNPR